MEASGLDGSRARFLTSGRWPLSSESLSKKVFILEASGLGGSQGEISGFRRVLLLIESLINKGWRVLDISYISGSRDHC